MLQFPYIHTEGNISLFNATLNKEMTMQMKSTKDSGVFFNDVVSVAQSPFLQNEAQSFASSSR
jgi:succinylarginine dihydrolase